KSANTDGRSVISSAGSGLARTSEMIRSDIARKNAGKSEARTRSFAESRLVMNVQVGRAVLSPPGDARRAVNGDWNVRHGAVRTPRPTIGVSARRNKPGTIRRRCVSVTGF